MNSTTPPSTVTFHLRWGASTCWFFFCGTHNKLLRLISSVMHLPTRPPHHLFLEVRCINLLIFFATPHFGSFLRWLNYELDCSTIHNDPLRWGASTCCSAHFSRDAPTNSTASPSTMTLSLDVSRINLLIFFLWHLHVLFVCVIMVCSRNFYYSTLPYYL